MKKVFVSYSHDSAEHKKWVSDLVLLLRGKGYNIQFDQTDLKAGHDVVRFMERGISESDFVIVVCTENYNNKADNGHGGVGYEKMIITSEILADQSTEKFIPIVVNVQTNRKTPLCLSTRLYIDFSNATLFEDCTAKLEDALGFAAPLTDQQSSAKGWSMVVQGQEFELRPGETKEIRFEEGRIEKYLVIENDILCLEQTFPDGKIAYMESDKDGNIIKQKFPYPITEYAIVINNESLIKVDKETNIDGNSVHTAHMKWGKYAKWLMDKNGNLLDYHVRGGCKIDHINKQIKVGWNKS